ncbi:MAG: hypothetical protein LJE69_11230 [Thiohalocapsa sp.]|jgi:hypothetical protein|uniref:hypothetical protein n=1 Tax=Thiohalocapsa sp. TaxID=2497641 RepID=UPI0025EA4B0E|nr:hypothetical protein [Thiohalocapsa sp.]MCG6941806.1 hypothetical protein [Thiohalocapsa sp.]
MLEALAIAALVVGGVSTAAVVTEDEVAAKQDNKPAVVEVQQVDTHHKTEAAKNPFLD